MTFRRVKTGKNGARYLYEETRWREGKKMRSKSRYLGRVGGGGGGPSSPGALVPALPFMIAYDLISGNRVAALREARAKGSKPSEPARAWAREKFDRQTIFDRVVHSPKTPNTPGFNSNAELVAALEAKEAAKSDTTPNDNGPDGPGQDAPGQGNGEVGCGSE